MQLTENLGLLPLEHDELIGITGGAEPAEGSYATGYAIGRWFNQMFQIWHYGLTHLSDR
ncbi:MAG: hypothetical protein WBV45_05160 [Lutimonas sp.]